MASRSAAACAASAESLTPLSSCSPPNAASEDLVEGMEAGADDYLTKPFNAQELRVRIRAGRRILDLQDALRREATHDGLTGLLNRNSILSRLTEEIVRQGREGRPLSVLMVDIDRFKR